MDLQTMELAARSSAAPLFVPAPDGEAPRLVCRCDGCGGAVTFDALIVSGACADQEPPRAADSTLH